MTRLRLIAGAIAIAVALVVAFAIGCRGRESNGEQDTAQGVVDMELMAFLSEARALHHLANLKEESNDLPGATAAMQRLVTARRPHEGKTTPEVEEVLADAYARLAELQLRQSALDAAAEAVKSGLAHAPEPTYFRGHLVEVDGLVEEARAAGLADAGKPEEAARAREKAIQLLEEVVRIQDQVIRAIARGARRGSHRGPTMKHRHARGAGELRAAPSARSAIVAIVMGSGIVACAAGRKSGEPPPAHPEPSQRGRRPAGGTWGSHPNHPQRCAFGAR